MEQPISMDCMKPLAFWDWTGTLADESELDKAVCEGMEEEAARNAGVPVERAREVFRRHLEHLEGRWQWHDYVRHGMKLGVEWRKCQEMHLGKLRLFPHAREILEYARSKGYGNVLATNAVSQVIRMRVEHAGLSGLFDAIIGSDDADALKSEGRHFVLALDELGADPRVFASSYSIGDNPVQDIESAKRYGIRTVFCAYGSGSMHYHSTHISAQHGEEAGADYVITSLSQIRSII